MEETTKQTDWPAWCIKHGIITHQPWFEEWLEQLKREHPAMTIPDLIALYKANLITLYKVREALGLHGMCDQSEILSKQG